MSKQYPPPGRSPEEVKIRYLPDGPENIVESMKRIGYRERLEKVVRDTLARVKRR